MPLPLLIAGAVGAAAWLAGRAELNARTLEERYPSVPRSWWKLRDRFYILKWRTLGQLRDLKSLEAMIRGYVAKNPDHGAGYGYAVAYYTQLGHWNAALELSQKLVALEPKTSVGHWDLGCCQFELKAFDEARLHLEKFLALEPGSSLRPHAETKLTQIRNLTKAPRKRAPKKKSPRR